MTARLCLYKRVTLLPAALQPHATMQRWLQVLRRLIQKTHTQRYDPLGLRPAANIRGRNACCRNLACRIWGSSGLVEIGSKRYTPTIASDVTLMCIAARRNGCTGQTAESGEHTDL